MSIKLKKTKQTAINYLTTEGIKLLLEQPNLASEKGRRDLALLSLMYDTGSRVQEIIDLTPLAIRLDKPYTIAKKKQSGKIITTCLDGLRASKMTKYYAKRNELFYLLKY